MVKFYLRRIGRRLSLLLLFPGLCSSSYAGSTSARLQDYLAAYNQSTSESAKTPLKEILTRLERAFGVRINYLEETVSGIYAATPPAKKSNVAFSEYLSQYLNSVGLQTEVVGPNIFLVYRSGAKNPAPAKKEPVKNTSDEKTSKLQQLVRGTVTDAKGEALIGVNVSLKAGTPGAGTVKAVATNAEGKFELRNVPAEAVLVFRYIGFKTVELKLAGRNTVNVKMVEDSQTLSNVVITGYQEINKESFTGSAVTVSGEDLKRVNPQNILQSIQTFDPSFKLLENNLVGSNPNSLPTINVRGSSSLPSGSGEVLRRDNITGNANLPTFIMDGFEVGLEKVFDLDVNRIESITLLKDAAATAVYGSRAANGVLIITTKAPKEGSLQVSYNYETTVTGPDLTDYQVLNASEKLEYERLAGLYSTTRNQALSQDELDELYYQKLENVVGGVNTYWLSQPLRTVAAQKHSMYVEGGSKVFRYGIDLRYQTQPGVMKGSSRDRYSGGMSFTYNQSNKLQIRNDLTVLNVKSEESPYGSFSSYVSTNPYYPMTDANGNTLREIDSWTDRGGPNNPGNAVRTATVLSPLYDATLSSFMKTSYLELIDALSADWTITKGLRLRGLASITNRNTDGNYFKSPLANEFYFYQSSAQDEKGRYTNSNDRITSVDANLRLTYVKQLGNHFANFVLGSNIRTSLSDYKEYTAIGFANDRFTSIGFAGGYPSEATPFSSLQRERLFGSFLSVNYSFKNKYLLDATVRADGSSKFGTENKVAPFWSVGLGWNLHKEDFLQNTIVSQLRLRATAGATGDVSFPAYLSKTTYSYYTNNWYSTGVGASVGSYGNENLGWQKTNSLDLGIDLGLFNDRLYLSPRIYRKRTNDLLADVVLPPSTGFLSYKENLGDMENKGAEVNFRWNALARKDFSLTFTANMVHNTNKIIKISNALKKYNDRADQEQTEDGSDGNDLRGVPLLRYNEGQSLNAIYAVPSLGIDPENGREIFVKKDGSRTYVWDVRDIAVVGDNTPTAEGSFGTNITVKNFFLSVNFQTRFGGDLYNQTLVDRVENADPRYNVDRRVLDERWKQPGDRTFYKDISNWDKTQVSSRFIQSDNVLNLQSVYLSYQADKKLASKLAMSSLRLAITANDVWRFSSVKQERGIDYPFARSVTFSVQTTF